MNIKPLCGIIVFGIVAIVSSTRGCIWDKPNAYISYEIPEGWAEEYASIAGPVIGVYWRPTGGFLGYIADGRRMHPLRLNLAFQILEWKQGVEWKDLETEAFEAVPSFTDKHILRCMESWAQMPKEELLEKRDVKIGKL